MTCYDCLHWQACRNILEHFDPELKNKKITIKSTCNKFKNKNDYITVNEVAEILSEEICDKPCNFSNVNEWLPYICDYKNNKDNCNCSNLECWKQYFKHSKRANDFWDKFFKINQEPGKMAKNEIKSEAIKECLAKVKNYIKTHCNPYGKPDFDYDTSIKILNYIDLIVDTSNL